MSKTWMSHTGPANSEFASPYKGVADRASGSQRLRRRRQRLDARREHLALARVDLPGERHVHSPEQSGDGSFVQIEPVEPRVVALRLGSQPIRINEPSRHYRAE